jgi:hypothetical protein
MLEAIELLIGQYVHLYIGKEGTLGTPIKGTLYQHHKYYRVNDTIFTFEQVTGVNVGNTFIFISDAVNH